MKLESKFDFNKILENTRFNTRLMVSLTADDNVDQKEQPLNIAVVLDRSGSMSGDKLKYVKMATKILSNQLNQKDTLSLTIYDNEIDKLVPPKKMKDMHGFELAVDSIRSGGMTYLSGGYEQGCKFANDHKSKDNVTRVMLLTDGLANEGITNPDQLASIALKKNQNGITTTTIGVGEDYDEFLLGKMAENGGGGTYFIENPDDAPGVFQEELGYLKSMAATKVTIKFIPKNKDIVFDQLNTYRVNDDGSYLLGDLYSGQKKSIVLETLIPTMSIGEGQDIGTFEIQYQDTSSIEIKEEMQSIPVTIDVVSAAEFENETADRDVTLEAAFLLVAKAKSEGIGSVEELFTAVNGNKRVSSVIKTALEKVVNSATGSIRLNKYRPTESLLPYPTIPDRKASVLSILGQSPIFFKGNIIKSTPTHVGKVHIYLDVSGSMEEYLEVIFGSLIPLRQYLHPIVHCFSTEVHDHSIKEVLSGRYKSTFGTHIDCVLKHIEQKKINKAMVITDGYVGEPSEHLLNKLPEKFLASVALTDPFYSDEIKLFSKNLFEIHYKENRYAA